MLSKSRRLESSRRISNSLRSSHEGQYLIARVCTKLTSSDLIGPSVDGHLIGDSPYNLLEARRWARRPFIAGNTKDEGTLFASRTTGVEDLRTGMRGSGVYHRTEATINELIRLYPADPGQGSLVLTAEQDVENAHRQVHSIPGTSCSTAPTLTSEQQHTLVTWSSKLQDGTSSTSPEISA